MGKIEVRIEDIPPQFDRPGVMRVNPHFYLKFATLWMEQLDAIIGLENVEIETGFDVPYGEAWVIVNDKLHRFDISDGNLS